MIAVFIYKLMVTIFVFGVIIIVHEFGHFVAAKKVGVKVEKFSLGFGPQLVKKKRNDTEYSIGIIPLGGYVKLAGDDLAEYKGSSYEYFAKPPGERFKIIFFGPLANYILGFLIFWLIFFVGYPTLTTKVGSLVDGFGAKDAGIKAGDKIIAVNGKKVALWEDLQAIIQSEKNTKIIRLSILRDDKELNLDVKIKEKEFSDLLGQKRNVGLIGIMPCDESIKIRHGLAKSFILSINKTWDLTLLTYKALWRMITGKLSFFESASGPIGISYITFKVASMGIIAILHLMAVLSISLAIFNFLPFPILDGGHILFLGLEKIRGRVLSLKTERIVTQAGLTLIITLAIIVSYNDVLKFYGDKISKFLGK